MLSRRDWLRSSALASAALLVRARVSSSEAPLPVVTVYKDPSCECCARWIKHLNKNGFVVTVQEPSSWLLTMSYGPRIVMRTLLASSARMRNVTLRSALTRGNCALGALDGAGC